MFQSSRNPPSDEHDKNPDDDLPVINIDDDPDNANWLRIVEQRRRKEQQGNQQEQPNGRQPL